MTPPLSIDSQPPFTTPDALQFQGPTPAPQQAQTRTGGEFYVLLYNQGGQHQGIHWAKSDAAGNLTFLRGGEEPRLNNPAHFQQLRQKLIASQMPQSAIVCYMESGMVWNQENIYGIAGAKLQWDGVPVTALEAPPSNIQQHDTYTLPGQPPTPPPRLGQRPPQTFVTSGPIANIACNTATTPLTWMACKVANKPMSNMPMSTVVCSWIIGLPGAIAGAIVGGIVGFFVGIVDAIRFRNPKFILNGMAGFALTGATWLSFLSGGFIGFFGAALVSRARG